MTQNRFWRRRQGRLLATIFLRTLHNVLCFMATIASNPWALPLPSVLLGQFELVTLQQKDSDARNVHRDLANPRLAFFTF